MKKITLLLLGLSLFIFVKAQKVYFVYLQSENQQPFYVRMGEKIYNSSPAGYLILSKLTDSIYSINIGLRESQLQEQKFPIAVNKKDQGYLLKKDDEKGLSLFNFQSFRIIMAAQNNPVNIVKTEKREANSFTDLLAKAADDSTLKERPVIEKVKEKRVDVPIQLTENIAVIKKENIDTFTLKISENKIVVLPDETKPELKKEITGTINIKEIEIKKSGLPGEKLETPKIESNLAQQDSEVKKGVIPPDQNIEKKPAENPDIDLYKKSSVIKRSESSTTEGFGITFLDIYSSGSTDTIRILIPSEKQKSIEAGIIKEDKKFLDIISQDTLNIKTSVEGDDRINNQNIREVIPDKTIRKNNICIQNATDEDFFKVRKKMAAEITDDKMINEAKRFFKIKCFTTEQIRNLSSFFLSEEGKYKFFDAAFSYVSDLMNYKLLQSELRTPYYINRFKAMLY